MEPTGLTNWKAAAGTQVTLRVVNSLGVGIKKIQIPQLSISTQAGVESVSFKMPDGDLTAFISIEVESNTVYSLEGGNINGAYESYAPIAGFGALLTLGQKYDSIDMFHVKTPDSCNKIGVVRVLADGDTPNPERYRLETEELIFTSDIGEHNDSDHYYAWRVDPGTPIISIKSLQ